MDFFRVGDIPDDRIRIITLCLRMVFSEFYTRGRGDNHISFSEPAFDEDYIPMIHVTDRVKNCENDVCFDIYILHRSLYRRILPAVL